MARKKKETLSTYWEKLVKDIQIHPWKHTDFFRLDISGELFYFTIFSHPRFTFFHLSFSKDGRTFVIFNKRIFDTVIGM